MLPKHQSECELEQPFQRSYFENQYGAKSIGEPSWKPHIRNALDCPDCQENTIKGGNGLDWFSSIRCPGQVEIEEKLTFAITEQKWTLITEDVPEFQPTLPTISKPKATEKGQKRFYEQTIEQRIGRRKKVKDVRNGIAERISGDKSYYTPEYSEGFHHHGSTLPVVNFGGSLETLPDTFIPLVKLPLQPRIPFHVKEKKREKTREINEVKELDYWMPAEPLKFP